LQYLELRIPCFKAKIQSNKLKIAVAFQEKRFNAGCTVISEGTPIKEIYLIKEGECKIVSQKMPIISRRILTSFYKSKAPLFLKDLLENKSYFSQTTNSFQLGILSANEWIGDEFLYFGEQGKLPYSVIATKPLLVYCLQKEDFQLKFSKDMQQFIQDGAYNKCKWIEQRFIMIITNLNKLKDSYFDDITEKSSEIKKKYPTAGSHALTNIRNKQYLTYAGDNHLHNLS